MSGIVGVLRLDGCPVDREALASMVVSLSHRGPDRQGVWCDESVGLGQGSLWTTLESLREEQPLSSPDKKLILTADARIDNREDLIKELNLRRGSGLEPTDGDLILAAYRHWGEHCPEQLIGDFAFAIWDQDRRQLFCARDPIGVKGLFYHYSPKKLFVFASEIKALFQVSEVPRALNDSRIADYLAFIFDDLESTFYRSIQRLPPGHRMTVNLKGLCLRRYWAFDPERELMHGSDAEYEEAFRELFIEAVRCRVRSAFPVGTTLSGGLDSSSIACVARNVLKADADRKLHTFSAIFPSLPKKDLRLIDERAYIDVVQAECDFVAHQIRADALSPLGDLDTVLWHQDEPHVPFNLYLHRGIYQSASTHGVRVLLDGFDGDTTVSHGYERLPELVRSFRWITLLKETRALSWHFANPGLLTWWKIVLTHALQPIIPPSFGHAWQRIRHPTDPPWGVDSIIDKAFAQRVGLEQRMHALRKVTSHSFHRARETHLRGLTSPLIPMALEQADKAAAAFQLEARYPFFDRRLMEYCLAVPADQKLRKGWPRSLLRRAMQGVLPPKVQWRRNKGDLRANFHRGLLNSGMEPVRRMLSEDGGAMRELIDVPALAKAYERYQANPSDADGLPLFSVITLFSWLSNRDV